VEVVDGEHAEQRRIRPAGQGEREQQGGKHRLKSSSVTCCAIVTGTWLN
jgi:hypothetical protein